jgi:carbohydrate kinase (thermoresistant glucokinase family)
MLEPMPAASSPAAIVIMGVSGSGKTEIGRRLAERLGWAFRDADEFHPAENIAKMRAGVPLVDADREPWLAALAAVLQRVVTEGPPLVLACSALKWGHRTRLGLPRTPIRLVHLDGPPGVIRRRIEQRAGHFMPATLLDSQLAALERPGPDENAIVVDVSPEPDAIVQAIAAALGLP